MKKRQHGQAYVEYVVGAVFVVGALFAPVFGGDSAIGLLMQAFQANQESYIWAMSVPG
ncbi:hypothetical protein [Alcanivorax hongdengensis]|uniref:hypothetical protein n=1 Tax=Alcanivorax hongdengensis TaxID=519051 RepID=UPI0002F9ABFC|nr:hypothetical protein [Alcanivorax hongdengensis]